MCYVCIKKCKEIIHLNNLLIYQLNMLFTVEYLAYLCLLKKRKPSSNWKIKVHLNVGLNKILYNIVKMSSSSYMEMKYC